MDNNRFGQNPVLFLGFSGSLKREDAHHLLTVQVFVIPEGTKKVSYERDTKIVNATSFTIERECSCTGTKMYFSRVTSFLTLFSTR